MLDHAKLKPILWLCAVFLGWGALQNKLAPFGCIRRQKLCWLAHFWREFYICMAESIQLKLPFALSSSPSNSKWGPQQSCCFLSLHHLPQFYHHWQPACKLQGQVCIKQIISECQQIMWGSDANLFTTFSSNTLKVLLCCVLWRHVIEQRICVCDVCMLVWERQKGRESD